MLNKTDPFSKKNCGLLQRSYCLEKSLRTRVCVCVGVHHYKKLAHIMKLCIYSFGCMLILGSLKDKAVLDSGEGQVSLQVLNTVKEKRERNNLII